MVAGRRIEFLELRRGMEATIVGVKCDNAAARLMEMGMTIGTPFKVVKVAPLNDPIEIDVRGYRLCLRRREADCFEIALRD
jgi:ferrous iron transport protein A